MGIQTPLKNDTVQLSTSVKKYKTPARFAMVALAFLGALGLGKLISSGKKNKNSNDTFKSPIYNVDMYPNTPYNGISPGMMPRVPYMSCMPFNTFPGMYF